MPESENQPDYLARFNSEGILFTDRDGKTLAIIKKSELMPDGYAVIDAGNKEICFITSWSKPALVISGMPLYASSTTLKIYDKANGVETGRMAVSAQSINSDKMNLSLLDRRDNIIGFIAETGSRLDDVYVVKGSGGHAFANVSVTTAGDVYSISVMNHDAAQEMIMVKLVAGQMLFNIFNKSL
jgi:hypothetical protein